LSLALYSTARTWMTHRLAVHPALNAAISAN
jgi:hypothetical protein